jgi:translation initiation factor IF-2
MNKEKIRIYELSKELDLENKDIIELCTELSIAVKSHSSTITETEAEAIRAEAKKYPAHKQKTTKKSQSQKSQSSSMAQSPESTSTNRKQEILAIYKHHRSSSPDNLQSEGNSPALLAPPPRPKTDESSGSSSLTPKGDNQPMTTASVGLKNPPPRPTPVKVKQPTENQDQPVPELKSPKPKLLNQPPNVTKDSSEDGSQRSTQQDQGKSKTNFPKDKNQRRQNKKEDRKDDRVEAKPALPTGKSSSEPSKIKPVIKPAGKIDEDSSLKVPSLAKPKLQKPQERPKPPLKIALENEDELADEVEETTTTELEIEPETFLLEKPKRLKDKDKQKRLGVKVEGKVWEDEEEEETKKKAAKSLSKGKRRAVIVEDEEEDFDLDGFGNEVGASFTMALARPQKAKSESSDTKEQQKKPQKPKPKLEKSEQKVERKDKQEKKASPEAVQLPPSLTVRELADLIVVPETDIIKQLFFKGIAVNITQTLDYDTAKVIVEELGIKVTTKEDKASAVKTEMLAEEDLENLHQRPPVVTIMGHVDHGKTTLLDSIRKTKVAQGEAGGITQHIGAYHVDVEHEGTAQQIVFLDTPGHEAFTAMRARGARVTDIAVLVVAADDGVQPQTREAISHAQAAKVPIVVAINKVDKPESNPDRVKQELMELGLVPEDWGGETIMVPVSALKGENLDGLLEMIVLVAEMEDLSANPDRLAKGTVIEAHLDRTRGPVATLLVQNGTLRVGDVIVAGSVCGKIRAMIDDRGERVEEASPSFAVEILGLNEVPAAGDEFDVYANEKEAKAIAETRAEQLRDHRLQQALSSRRVSLSSISAQAQQGELKELNLILKGDVQGSVEAILGSLQQLPQKEVQIRVLLASAGEVTETDVDLAAASGAIIIGFNTTLAPGARHAADQEGVDIREYNIIYKLLDDIQGAMEGLLEPEEVEEHLGTAEVRAVFTIGRNAVAGCYVQSGKLVRNRFIRVRRRGQIIYQGNLESLRRVKDDVKEVAAGYECGIGVPKFTDWQEGDSIEAYEMTLVRRTLSK